MMNTLNGQIVGSGSYTGSIDSYYWKAEQITRVKPGFDRNELTESTPANVELLEWAQRPENQPPQAWLESGDDPFDPG